MSTMPLEREAIEARIPHRPPFLFLDRVSSLGPQDPPETLSAEWRVPESGSFLDGHYPGNPVTPGVILCEHAFQAAAMLLSERGATFGAKVDVPVLARIEKAKFRRIVRPGELVFTEVRLVDTVGPAFYLQCKTSVGEEPVLELRCVLTRTAHQEAR